MKRLITVMILSIISIMTLLANDVLGITTKAVIFDGTEWKSFETSKGIKVLLADKAIYIASETHQVYNLYNISEIHINDSGHEQYTSEAINQDGVNCYIRIVFRDDIEAPCQLYIYYNDIQMVYNIIFYKNNF